MARRSRSVAPRRSGALRRVGVWARRIILLGVAAYGVAGFVSSRLVPAPVLVQAGQGPAPPGEPGAELALATSAGAEASPGALVWRRLDCAGEVDRCAAVRPDAQPELLGVSSVHTGRSGDARGSFDDVARSASKAGLDFVLVGDHAGDWLHAPDAMAPRRIDGVLVVPGQELVVDGVGRTLTIGLDTLVSRWEESTEALGRRVEAAGGFVAVVHPRSPRGRERWNGVEAPGLHAWEALDVSEVARIRLKDRWAAYHMTSFLGGLVAGWAHRSVLRLNREGTAAPGLLAYDSARVHAPLTLLAALNHHPKARVAGVLVPGYTPFFRTHVNHVSVAAGEGDPLAARARVLDGLRSGRVFVSLGDAPKARGFRVAGWSDGVRAPMGGTLGWRPGSELLIHLPPAADAALLIRLLVDGAEAGWVEGRPGDALAVAVPRPGTWRVEAYRAGTPLGRWRFDLRPWLLSNPVEFTDPTGDRLAER